MFLWVALQIESLCGMETDQAIRDTLVDLPIDLAETFNRILRKSNGKGKSYQTKILQLITVAQQPLTAGDLQEALSVVPGTAVGILQEYSTISNPFWPTADVFL